MPEQPDDVALADLTRFADEAGLPHPVDARHVVLDRSAMVTVTVADATAAQQWAAALGARPSDDGTWTCTADATDPDTEVDSLTYVIRT